VKDVAEAAGFHEHLLWLVTTVRSAGILIFIALHQRWRAAHELNGPFYANATLTTKELVKDLGIS